MKKVILKPKRDFSLRQGHPWVFSGAIATEPTDATPGESVEVYSAQGEKLAIAAWSPQSQIRLRVWALGADAVADDDTLLQRIPQAVARRASLWKDRYTTGIRLINAEGDDLPGIVADRYHDAIVVQLTTAAAQRLKSGIIDHLSRIPGVRTIWERSQGESLAREGISVTDGLLWGEPPVGTICCHENGLQYHVDITAGHKTGFYLDQRDNRQLIGKLATNLDVLNTFCYTGGFGLEALRNGAKTVTQIDASAEALAIAKRNAELNQLDDPTRHELVEANVFDHLRRYRDAGRSFDLVILDPPKFADRKAQLQKAIRGYKDINILGIKLLRRNGLLATFSCSAAMDNVTFREVVQQAALDAHRPLQILRELQAPLDHPQRLGFPEGHYLKGLLLRAL